MSGLRFFYRHIFTVSPIIKHVRFINQPLHLNLLNLLPTSVRARHHPYTRPPSVKYAPQFYCGVVDFGRLTLGIWGSGWVRVGEKVYGVVYGVVLVSGFSEITRYLDGCGCFWYFKFELRCSNCEDFAFDSSSSRIIDRYTRNKPTCGYECSIFTGAGKLGMYLPKDVLRVM